MIKIAAKDLKPLDVLFATNSMVKSITPSDDTHVKVSLYGKRAVYYENNEMLQITTASANLKRTV
jgi:hypothetical protein